MRWQESWRADPLGAALADRHYSRQKPGSRQFVPPGRCVVLRTEAADAVWTTSWPFAEYVKHAWPGAWVNSLFRNESGHLTSDLIREAVAATRWYWPDIPALGMVTMVDPSKVRSTNPGYCYECAGFRKVGKTKSGQIVWQLLPDEMPEAVAPVGAALSLLEVA